MSCMVIQCRYAVLLEIPDICLGPFPSSVRFVAFVHANSTFCSLSATRPLRVGDGP